MQLVSVLKPTGNLNHNLLVTTCNVRLVHGSYSKRGITILNDNGSGRSRVCAVSLCQFVSECICDLTSDLCQSCLGLVPYLLRVSLCSYCGRRHFCTTSQHFVYILFSFIRRGNEFSFYYYPPKMVTVVCC